MGERLRGAREGDLWISVQVIYSALMVQSLECNDVEEGFFCGTGPDFNADQCVVDIRNFNHYY